MLYTLEKKVISSLLLITSVIFTSNVEAVTTLGQEEDAFSKIWSHQSREAESMKLHLKKQDKSQLKKEEKEPKTEKCTSRKCLSETIKLLHNKDLIGSRLY